MKSDQLSKWLTFGANVGVLVGIILLILELDQNRELVKAQTRHAVADQYINYISETAYSEDMAALIVRVIDGAELSREEQLRYQFRLRTWFRIAANVHYQYSQGLFDEVEFITIKESWRGYANSNRAIGEFWCIARRGYSPDFQSAMNAVLANIDC